jgi:hypothetical protein
LFLLTTNVLYEFLRIEYLKDASDWVRIYVQTKRMQRDYVYEEGVKVTKEDEKDFERFIAPIRQHYKEAELEREKKLDVLRNKKPEDMTCIDKMMQ